MRRIGLALALAAVTAGCSFVPGSSSSEPEESTKTDFAGTEKGFADATTLYANKRYEQAARLCEKTIQARPYYAPAHLLLARSHHAAGKDDSAIPRYRALLNLSPNHVEGLTELAAVHRSRGEADQAVPLLERAFERTEGREDVAIALAECLKEAGDFDRAREVAARAGVLIEDPPVALDQTEPLVEQLLPDPPSEETPTPAAPPEEEEMPTAPQQPPVEEPTPVAQAADPVPPPAEEEPQPPEEPRPPLPNPEPPKPKEATPPVAAPDPPKPEPPQPREVTPPVAKPEPPKPPAKDAAPVAEKPKKASPPSNPPEAPVAETPVRMSPEAQQWIEEGDRSLAEGLAASAIEAYKRSKEHGGPEAILSARVERATKSREEAQRTARELSGPIQATADSTGQRLRLAAAYLQDGRYLEAKLLLVQLTVITPDSGEGFYLLGIAYESRSEWQQAAEAFKKAQALCPGTALDVQAGFHLEEIGAHLDH
ncbi:MAG: tetratricopeptide repeat protein [Planctomycetota bacterium]